jgi:hypothetical protein
MSKLVQQAVYVEASSTLSPSQPIEVVIPYDRETGRVYLNAIGANVHEAMEALRAISLDEDAHDRIDTINASLEFSEAALQQADLFPVHVPFDRETGAIFIAGIGSNYTEALVNLDFWNQDQGNFAILRASLVMPQMILKEAETPKLPSL